jgi:hypothetical protein
MLSNYRKNLTDALVHEVFFVCQALSGNVQMERFSH